MTEVSPRKSAARLLAWIDQGTPEGDPKAMPPPRAVRRRLDDRHARRRTVDARGLHGARPRGRCPTSTSAWRPGSPKTAGFRRPKFSPAIARSSTTSSCGSSPPEARPETANPREPFFAAFVVGDAPSIFPPGTARKVPAGAEFHFEVHYSPTGASRPDRSAIGLIFAKTPPVHQVITKGIKNGVFVIPPGAKNHEVKSSFTFRSDSHLLSLMPHMHLRGQDFRYTATLS